MNPYAKKKPFHRESFFLEGIQSVTVYKRRVNLHHEAILEVLFGLHDEEVILVYTTRNESSDQPSRTWKGGQGFIYGLR